MLRSLSSFWNLVELSLFASLAVAQLHPKEPATYQGLPTLRERAIIQDKWTAERIANIPSLLKKYDAQAWLVGTVSARLRATVQLESNRSYVPDLPQRTCRRYRLVVHKERNGFRYSAAYYYVIPHRKGRPTQPYKMD